MGGRHSRRWISPRRSDSAIDAALRFLAARPRTEYEVRTRLRRGGFEPATIEATVAQLRNSHLLDDAEFAQYWVGQRRAFRPRGAQAIRGELRRLGIAADTVEQAVDVLEPHAHDDAYRVAAKRAQQLQRLDERTFTTKLSQFLARRGFDWETIATVVAQLWRERDALSTS